MRAALEWDVHKNDDRSAIGNCEAAILSGRYRTADGLKAGCELLCPKRRNRFRHGGTRLQNFNAAHRKRRCGEVGQMQFVQEVHPGSIRESRGLEWHTHLKLEREGDRLRHGLL